MSSIIFASVSTLIVLVLDASSKFDMGLLTGNTKLYGNYDLCISVQNNVKGSAVDGQYCTIPFTLDDYLKKDLYNSVSTRLWIQM